MSSPSSLSTSNTQQEDDLNSTYCRTTMLNEPTNTDSSSEYTLKPTLPTISEENEQENNSWKKSVKAAYLKFEAKTPHGKDRIIMQARKTNGVRTEKLGEKIQPRVMIWQSAPWAMTGLGDRSVWWSDRY